MPDNSLPFAAIPGFDLAKIQDLSHVNDKYSPALRAFSQAMAAGIPLTRGNLAPQVDWAKGHGFANAKQVGDDSVDYGDTRGPIDLIRGGDDATMFLDKAVWPNAPTKGDPAQGFQSIWAKGAIAPSNAPAGMHWDANLAMYQPDAPGQQDIVNQSLQNLAPAQGSPDQILGTYDDELRRQLLEQMQV